MLFDGYHSACDGDIGNESRIEAGTGVGIGFDNNTAIVDNNFCNSSNGVFWSFARRPGFFDEVCYSGNGSTQSINHNLGVAPELIITKPRNAAGTNWFTYAAPSGANKYLIL